MTYAAMSSNQCPAIGQSCVSNDINMIVTRERGYVHLLFRETCNDESATVLAVIEKMFKAAENLPEGYWLVRARPEIIRDVDFSTGKKVATVQLRASSQVPVERPVQVHFGLGRRGR
jgi:hypothetical protein